MEDSAGPRMIKNNRKIIDKIYKCFRLSESGNANEAALALRQATKLMKKYDISDAQVLAAEVSESAIKAGEHFNPPYWALALANLVAEAFQCRNLISRRYGRLPEFRFIGLGYKAEVATYSYTVLHRYLSAAIDEFSVSAMEQKKKDEWELKRRIEVFAQAWLFRVGRTVSDFVGENTDNTIIDDYIMDKYGEAVELKKEPTKTQSADYNDILMGMRAANEVALYRSVGHFIRPRLLHQKHAV